LTISSKPALTLRDATHADLASINDMHVRSRASAYRGQIADHTLDVAMPATSPAMWAERLPRMLAGAGRIWIAQSHGLAIGFICVLAADAAGSVYVNNLHALPEHKGRGAGSALLDAAERWARGAGARRMHLNVLASNRPAIGFYESRGWRCVDRVEETWFDANVVALVYALDLEPVTAPARS
jgi:ribosomal protein S18 acetylase RimI-like enzyme